MPTLRSSLLDQRHLVLTGNTEATWLAPAVTGRDVVLLFNAHYHGHPEEALVNLDDGTPWPVLRGPVEGCRRAYGSVRDVVPDR